MDEPKRDKKYLEWICTLPCIVTGWRMTVAHHQCERHKKAMGLKCSDYRAVPLLPEVHKLYHDKLGWKIYDENDVNIEEVIKTLNVWWQLFHVRKTLKKPIFTRNVSQINELG